MGCDLDKGVLLDSYTEEKLTAYHVYFDSAGSWPLILRSKCSRSGWTTAENQLISLPGYYFIGGE